MTLSGFPEECLAEYTSFDSNNTDHKLDIITSLLCYALYPNVCYHTGNIFLNIFFFPLLSQLYLFKINNQKKNRQTQTTHIRWQTVLNPQDVSQLWSRDFGLSVAIFHFWRENKNTRHLRQTNDHGHSIATLAIRFGQSRDRTRRSQPCLFGQLDLFKNGSSHGVHHCCFEVSY
jgi:hypothetical protein